MDQLSKQNKQDVKNMARAFITAAQKFYEDPENVRKFEEWKRIKNTNN